MSGTVYVVDDDVSYLSSVGRMLRASGYTVKSFLSAEGLLEQQVTETPACVVADLRMPGMDGLALQRALAESGNPLPVVFLSGRGDIPDSVQAMRDGAEDFLTKTAPKAALLDAIERALRRDAREREGHLRRREIRMRLEQFTPREELVLAHVLRGRMNKQIAADLGINERSVKRHRTSLMRKLGIKSVAELVAIAGEAGWTAAIGAP